MTLSHVRIGIDVGGTKIAGAVLAPNDEVLAEMQVATPREDYEATLMAIADIVTDLEKSVRQGTASVGVGIPGSILPKTGLVQNANATWINGRPMRDDLTRLLRRLVRCANDANCFVLSEAADGAGLGAKSIFGVMLGSGGGGGFVFNRRLVDGPRANAGEWSHNPLPWPEQHELPGPRCWCGKHGCLETWVSAPGIERDFLDTTGRDLSAEDIAAARDSDPEAKAALDRHASRLARGMATVVNILDPEVIVLGGSLSKMDHLYADLPRLMAPYIFSQDRTLDIRRPVHGPNSGVRGAARLWEMA